MLIFIVALVAMLMSWLIGEAPGKGSLDEAAWTEAPPFLQTMTTNVRVTLAGDEHLFFPSDALYFQHTAPATDEKPRRTAYLGKQPSMVMYLPQQRAVRDQLARHGANPDLICARAPQDINAAILWKADKPEDAPLGQKPADKRSTAGGHIPKPAVSLYLMHRLRKPAFATETERDAVWKSLMESLKKNAGKPVDVTDKLGLKPADGRVFAKSLPTGLIVSFWRVTPVEHPIYRYRIELEQDTGSPASAITTAIFASTDAIEPCLDLSERISARAISSVQEARMRTRFD